MPIWLAVFAKNWMLCCKEPHVHLQLLYERDMNASAKLPSGSRVEKPTESQDAILTGTMPSPKTDVKKNLDICDLTGPSHQALLYFSSHGSTFLYRSNRTDL